MPRFWGGGIAIIDCTDLANMQLVGHISWSPPFHGSNHTAWPLGDRPYLICTDEARAKQKFWDSQFMWVVDIREETNPIPVATFFPDREKYFNRPGRFGAHNVLEYMPADGPWKDIVFLTYFNAGLRAVDVAIRCGRRRSAASCRRCRTGRRTSSRTTSAATSTAGSI